MNKDTVPSCSTRQSGGLRLPLPTSRDLGVSGSRTARVRAPFAELQIQLWLSLFAKPSYLTVAPTHIQRRHYIADLHTGALCLAWNLAGVWLRRLPKQGERAPRGRSGNLCLFSQYRRSVAQ